jgi:hypothetical protein
MAAFMSGFKDGRQVIVPVPLEFTGGWSFSPKIRYYKDVPLCENYVRDFFIAAILPVSVKLIQRHQSLNTENPTPSVSPPFWQ